MLSRTAILEHVWDFAYDGTSNVVDVYVRYLREKVDRPFGRDCDRDRAWRRLPAPRRRRLTGVGLAGRFSLRTRLAVLAATGAMVVLGVGALAPVPGSHPRAEHRHQRRARHPRRRPGHQPPERHDPARPGARRRPGGRPGRRVLSPQGATPCSPPTSSPVRRGGRSSSTAGSPGSATMLACWPVPSGARRPTPSSASPRRRRPRSCGPVIASPSCCSWRVRAGRGDRRRHVDPDGCRAATGASHDQRSRDHLDCPRRAAAGATAPATTRSPSSAETSTPCSPASRRSIAHERAFIDDAAHELRTPIAVLRGELELAAHDPGDRAAVSQGLASALGGDRSADPPHGRPPHPRPGRCRPARTRRGHHRAARRHPDRGAAAGPPGRGEHRGPGQPTVVQRRAGLDPAHRHQPRRQRRSLRQRAGS